MFGHCYASCDGFLGQNIIHRHTHQLCNLLKALAGVWCGTLCDSYFFSFTHSLSMLTAYPNVLQKQRNLQTHAFLRESGAPWGVMTKTQVEHANALESTQTAPVRNQTPLFWWDTSAAHRTSMALTK